MTKHTGWLKAGVVVFAVGSIACGVLDLLWRELEPAHQPLQAWVDPVPHMALIGFLAGVWLLAGGVALLSNRSAAAGAAALAVVYGVFALFPVPRLWIAPHYLGHTPAVYAGVLVSVCQQLILCVAAGVLWRLQVRGGTPAVSPLVVRILFGACSIVFGLGHLTSVPAVTPMIPAWMPGPASFWVVLTGWAFVLAGIAIAADVLAAIAAQLLGWMLLVFSMLVLTPRIASASHAHVAWGSDSYNLTAVGACWIVSGWLMRATTTHKLQG